jgi:hypothetical protein
MGIKTTFAAVAMGLAVCACSGNPAASSSAASVATPTPVACPNPEGGVCLGPIAAGTYTTENFDPTLTYSVPEGWSNFEDTTGNFLLVPPGYDLSGVNGDTGDFIGVYAKVAAPNGCDPGTAPGVGFAPADLKAWYEQQPGLEVTSEPTLVGGRKGFVLEIRMRDPWKETCPYANGHPIVPLLVGVGRTGLDHNIGGGRAWRLYLLENGTGTMAVEVVDIADAGHLAGYAKIVEAMVFGD